MPHNSLPRSLGLLILFAATAVPQTFGAFDDHTDIGGATAGSASYDAAAGEYKIAGGGANIWATSDAFQFLWKRVTGDASLSADVRFEGEGKVAHRKAVLMIRQSLDAGSAYADAAAHGDGLTSLQYRATAGGTTLETRATQGHLLRLRIERKGDQFTMYAGNAGEELTPVGPVTVAMPGPVYIGLGVCSHDAGTLETAIFSNVKIEAERHVEDLAYVQQSGDGYFVNCFFLCIPGPDRNVL